MCRTDSLLQTSPPLWRLFLNHSHNTLSSRLLGQQPPPPTPAADTSTYSHNHHLLGQQTAVGAVLERVPPPLGEVVRLADGAEDGEVEDEGDDLRAAVERAGDDVVVWRGG